MKKINLLMLLLLVATLTLGAINIHLSNRVAEESLTGRELKKQLNTLDEQNRMFNSEILQYSSLETISSRAAELGFVETSKFMSLYTPLPLARHE